MRELPILELNLNEPEKFGNVAAKLDAEERRVMAQDLIELVGVDENSMSDWAGKAQGYLDKVNNVGHAKPQNREQEGSGEKSPPSTEMVLSAVIQFSARATDALLGEPDLARASEPGGEPLAAWVSSQLRTKDPNWTLDTDPLVVHMAVTGLSWRKRDFDDIDRVFHSHFLTCKEVIINDSVRAIERAPRVTHQFERYPYEIERSIARKKWIDYDPRFDELDPQAPKRFYETDLWMDLDGDGMDEPWTVTTSRDDHPEVVRIRPRWSKKTVVSTKDVLFFNAIRRFYPYRFLPDPEGRFLPMGFGKLLDRVGSSADDLLASITDTAKSESENGGIAGGSQFGMPDKIELKGNRLTTIPTDGQPLERLLQMFPMKSVSAGSVSVLEKLMALGDRLAGTLNVLDKAPASMTATMAKGIIDNGAQVQSAVHRRLVSSMTQEFRMFVQMADAYDMLPEGVMASGAEGIAVTADPQLATEMQRSALAGVYMQLLEDPLTSWKESRLRLYRTLRLPEPEKMLGQPPAAPEATPDEKMKGALGLMKQKTEEMKVKADVAVKITLALKQLVEAGGGMIDQRAALLQMAQLEQVVQELTSGGNGTDGMAQQPPNQNAPGVLAPPQGGGSPDIPGGLTNGANPAGPGSGLA